MEPQLVGELPPVERHASTEVGRALQEAKRLAVVNPGEWVKVGVRTSRAMPNMVRSGVSSIGLGFDAAGRGTKDGKIDLYIKYIGGGE